MERTQIREAAESQRDNRERALSYHRGRGRRSAPHLGRGSAYSRAFCEEALVYELEQRGLGVERPKLVPLVYKDRRLAAELRICL